MRLRQPIPGYRIVHELGRGSTGILSLAFRESDSQAYALRTIIPFADYQAGIERFLLEARILRQLQHPNIVALRDEGEIDGTLFFAMDYVPGTDASKLLRRDGPLELRRALRFVCPMLHTLAHAHARKFLHRDIKPSSLLVAQIRATEFVRLANFGLACVYPAPSSIYDSYTGVIEGTIGYMPPEQITAFHDARPTADQYAAAATLYNLLTGKYVYDLPEGDFPKQLRLILNEDPVPIRQRRGDIPKGVAEAIHRALAREPGDRFPSVAAFREALLPFC